MSIYEVLVLCITVINKIAVVGIALWAIWALQTVFLNDEWVNAYPFIQKWPVRLSIALIASGFAIDALSVYTPGISEVAMNVGIFVLMHLFRKGYKRTNGNGHIIRALTKEKTNS